MHKNNLHQENYNFKILVDAVPALEAFVFKNEYNTLTINFANPEGVKTLNEALLKTYYGINYWEFNDMHLCPPIPGRVDYVHYLKDILSTSGLYGPTTILDIGTGATCIYPLLGNAVYNWKFIASDVDATSLKNAKVILDKNALKRVVDLRLQNNSSKILDGILSTSEKVTATMCNPPFYKSAEDALQATSRKWKGLKLGTNQIVRNFSGTANELWYKGGEKAFLHNYLYESSLFKKQCFWYTSLVSNKDLVKPMKKSLQKLGATQIKVIDMKLGNKISRVVAWTFLDKEAQKDFIVVNS